MDRSTSLLPAGVSELGICFVDLFTNFFSKFIEMHMLDFLWLSGCGFFFLPKFSWSDRLPSCLSLLSGSVAATLQGAGISDIRSYRYWDPDKKGFSVEPLLEDLEVDLPPYTHSVNVRVCVSQCVCLCACMAL